MVQGGGFARPIALQSTDASVQPFGLLLAESAAKAGEIGARLVAATKATVLSEAAAVLRVWRKRMVVTPLSYLFFRPQSSSLADEPPFTKAAARRRRTWANSA